MAKIVFVSDFNLNGSGYLNISTSLCTGLSNLGHEVMAVGLGYLGQPHPFPFSIIPCSGFGDAHAMTNNLIFQWKAELVIVAMDIPYLEEFAKICNQLKIPIIVITPLENPPLTFSWAMILQKMNKVFFISQLGTDEARKVGVDAEHIMIGMDTLSWRQRTDEEYKKGREMLNISPDTMVVLSVADNQERKNLSKAFEIISEYRKLGKKVRYILVTRENSEVGWRLRDLAMYYNIASEVMIFERGIPFKELYALYAISDAYLLTSKAEGLCMPVMEAMSVGIPVIATNCGAMSELLGTDYEWERGYLMETEYSMIDPWGNSFRTFPSTASGVKALLDVSVGTLVAPNRARIYMESRTMDIPAKQLADAIEVLLEKQ